MITRSGMMYLCICSIGMTVMDNYGKLHGPETLNKMKKALDYVHVVEKEGQCDSRHVLMMDFDHTGWNQYASIAVSTANFVSTLLALGSGKLETVVTEETLFAITRNNVRKNRIIFGAGMAFEPQVFPPHERFSPFSYKTNGSMMYSLDISQKYDYLKPEAVWYNKVKNKTLESLSFWTDKIQYRRNCSLSNKSEEIIQPVIDSKDGYWTFPYFDCSGANIWMVTYSTPILWLKTAQNKIIFKGAAFVDIELTYVDINQCDISSTNSSFDVFHGTHNCQLTTKCVPVSGMGFRRGAYECHCLPGFYFPNTTRVNKFFSGTDLEEYYDEHDFNHTGLDSEHMCAPCARGCRTCIDNSPCMFELNLAVRVLVVFITMLTIIVICVLWIGTCVYRRTKPIKSGSPIFLQVMCIGGFLKCTEMFVIYKEPTDTACKLHVWPRFIGFTLLYGALTLKTWRISVIFRIGSAKRVQLRDKVLLQRLSLMLLATVVLLSAWTAVGSRRSVEWKTVQSIKFKLCSKDWWEYAALGAEAVLLLFGAYLCFTVRKVPAEFNESRYITWSIYNALILGTFLLIIKYSLSIWTGPDILYIIHLLHLQITVTVTLCLIYIPKLLAIHKMQRRTIPDLDCVPMVSRLPTTMHTTFKAQSKKDVFTQTDPAQESSRWLPKKTALENLRDKLPRRKSTKPKVFPMQTASHI